MLYEKTPVEVLVKLKVKVPTRVGWRFEPACEKGVPFSTKTSPVSEVGEVHWPPGMLIHSALYAPPPDGSCWRGSYVYQMAQIWRVGLGWVMVGPNPFWLGIHLGAV